MGSVSPRLYEKGAKSGGKWGCGGGGVGEKGVEMWSLCGIIGGGGGLPKG